MLNLSRVLKESGCNGKCVLHIDNRGSYNGFKQYHLNHNGSRILTEVPLWADAESAIANTVKDLGEHAD